MEAEVEMEEVEEEWPQTKPRNVIPWNFNGSSIVKLFGVGDEGETVYHAVDPGVGGVYIDGERGGGSY
jgi:hypothetical protein